MKVKINKIQPSLDHEKIYQINDIDDLKESIQELGLLEKIVVTKNMHVLSGHRRLLAIKQLGYTEVDVDISDVSSDNEPLALISYNKHRVKTYSEMLNEVNYLKAIWGMKRGRKSKADTKGSGGKLDPVNTRKKIAEKTNISEGNLSKLEYIQKLEPKLIVEMDRGKLSLNQAHLALKKNEENKKIKNISDSFPTTITRDNYKIFNKSSADLSDLEKESIQLIFTSPPYYKIRKFTNDENELGAESSSEDFVQNLANHIHSSHKVLKPEGSLFLNLGDSYENKMLLSIPHRVMLELVSRGWILRNTIIWKKKSPLCFSSKDGLTPSYEFIFHLVKSKKYYYKEILMPLKNQSVNVAVTYRKSEKTNFVDNAQVIINGLKEGKKLEDYWTEDIVQTASSNKSIIKKYGNIDHPATFPELISIMPILQTTKPGDIVLDLFSGTGTTSAVALKLGRKTIAYELNPNYNKLQEERFNDAIETYNTLPIVDIAA